MCVAIPKIFPVVFRLDAGRAGDDGLEIRVSRGQLKHHRQVIADFLAAASGQDSEDGTIVEPMMLPEIRFLRFGKVRGDGIDRRIADVIHRIVQLPIKIGLEGQDTEHPIDITPYVPYPILLPSPYLRRYVIIHRNAQLGLHVPRNLQVEARIIHQNDDIRPVRPNLFLAPAHIAQNRSEVH